MDYRYKEYAEKLSRQKKQRYRVVRRRKIVEGITAVLLMTALSAGVTYLAIKGWIKEDDARIKAMAEFRNKYVTTVVSSEERKEAYNEYKENYFSVDTLEKTKLDIINEYGVLIEMIVENEAMMSDDAKINLDTNRINNTINNYGNFKQGETSIDYQGLMKIDRVEKASSYYNEKLSILKTQIAELNLKDTYLNEKSEKYLNNQQQKEKIRANIAITDQALTMVGEQYLNLKIASATDEKGR